MDCSIRLAKLLLMTVRLFLTVDARPGANSLGRMLNGLSFSVIVSLLESGIFPARYFGAGVKDCHVGAITTP